MLDNLIKDFIKYIGEDPKRDGLKDTPKRVARAWELWLSGYSKDPKDIMRVFDNPGIDQMIIVRDIEFYSHCEHHLAPFFGKVHIGYIPNDKILGVSKFVRLVEIYARRLQIQERLTQQIADDIMKFLKPQGVGVVVEAQHLCMRSRGVKSQNSIMRTNVMLGNFREVAVKNEFLNAIRG